ncbi:MAG: tRNA (adenosine(37)-N6)-threonylcarbamoyltransferase complex dimerization subunit type 1 TsaB [Planctomycetes bacterium]|nr:tRNA (adenosine(37)-N6)-threonylcarbamoyltransferase complex dimerization subunit type 1 TsaB [Planctomycetota bacterium]
MAQKPLILAIETSGRMGSVAIALGRRMLAEAAFSGPMRHSSESFPAICKLLNRLGQKPKDIEHIYISIGPGSFTGLRIAVTMAKTMHLANSTKIVAVDTLDVIAANTDDYMEQEKTVIETIAVILDAKRSQFYIAVYEHISDEQRMAGDENWKKIVPDSLMTASQFLDRFAGKAKPVWLLGEGLVYYEDKFKAQGVRFLDKSYWDPRAQKVHMLGWKMACAGQFADPVTLQPKYLRRPEAEEKQMSRT